RSKVRYGSECRLRKAKSKSLIGKEKESRTLEKWPTEGSAKIILPFFSLRQGRAVCIAVEPVVSVENVIPDIVESTPMHLICAGSGDDRNLRSWGASKFRSICRCLDPKLLHSIN